MQLTEVIVLSKQNSALDHIDNRLGEALPISEDLLRFTPV